MMSAALPGLNGMIARMGRLGHSSARLAVAQASAAHAMAKTKVTRLRMSVP
jgi:hypothetical protein